MLQAAASDSGTGLTQPHVHMLSWFTKKTLHTAGKRSDSKAENYLVN